MSGDDGVPDADAGGYAGMDTVGPDRVHFQRPRVRFLAIPGQQGKERKEFPKRR